ncbi:hypothetical protein [Salinibaculum salinum]|uniref:hypothetical protein n=1 Tax=Salinibaculum salinum TaxID=3131996 RepID=UPI0030EB3D9D
MAPVGDVLSVFEGESRRIIWLPPVTLGYIYTLSGSYLDFWLAVGAIAGARYFYDILEMAENRLTTGEDENKTGKDEWADISSDILGSLTGLKMLAILVYCAAFVLSIVQMYNFFSHEQPILVGLAGIYWGVLFIVVLNLVD